MISVHHFVFSDFLENTYLLWDETNECVIVDPGCYYAHERDDLKKFIEGKSLKPVLLLNTHTHIDHIFGNKWVKETFRIDFMMNQKEEIMLKMADEVGKKYGLYVEPSPLPEKFLQEGDKVKFGNSSLDVLFTPGHSPGSISFLYGKDGDAGQKVSEKSNQSNALHRPFIVSGDVLFQSSIGRTDLPGGDYETLMQSIFSKLLVLPDETIVYSGHGPVTTIGEEKKTNPFVLEYSEANS